MGDRLSGFGSGLLTLAIAIGLLALLVSIPIRIARERNHPNKEAITACAVLGLLLWPLLLVAIIWAYTQPARPTLPLSKPMSRPPSRPKGYAGSQSLSMPEPFPVTQEDDNVCGDDGPGTYKVSGVDRASKMAWGRKRPGVVVFCPHGATTCTRRGAADPRAMPVAL
jgi:hypothetical protein